MLLADIYAARETDTLGISSRDVAEAINADQPGKARYFGSFGEIEDYLDTVIAPGDLVLTMGAGDIFRVGEELLERIKNSRCEKIRPEKARKKPVCETAHRLFHSLVDKLWKKM